MRRRAVVAGLPAIVVAATAAHAQPAPPRVVMISNADEAGQRPFAERFRRGMRELGQVEGRTWRLEILYADFEPTRSATLIRDAVAGAPDVLVVGGLTNASRARDATSSVPIVVATGSDLVEAGIVASLARPGGNITGIADLSGNMTAKRLELLRDLLPNAALVALLINPDFPAAASVERAVRAAAATLKLSLVPLHATDRATLASAIDSLGATRVDALIVIGDALFTVNARELIERATARGVPVAHYWPGTAEAGALFSHQVDVLQNYERAAWYVDRILKGAKPGDLPIEQPTRYELVINRKAAEAFGIALPEAALMRADRVIE